MRRLKRLPVATWALDGETHSFAFVSPHGPVVGDAKWYNPYIRWSGSGCGG